MIDRERDAPDLEDLAAYVDGRLTGERKARVEERLLRDEDYYEVFMESVRFREEDAASGGGEVVAPAAWHRSRRVIAPLAVAAALVAVIGLWRLGSGPSTGEWVAGLDAAAIVAREDWSVTGWSVLRSGTVDRERYRPEQLAFRIGARSVDLRVALAAGHRTEAMRLTAMLEQLTHAADLFFESAGYGELLRDVESAALAELEARSEGIETSLAKTFAAGSSLEESRFRLGAWTEAGRLAALSGNAEILSDVVRNRRLARSAADIAPHLETLDTVLERPDPGKEGFESAVGAFSGIAAALGG